jgi:aspartate/methionine/tyrosine aminotransferase
LNQRIGKRSKIITEILKPIPQIKFNETFGAFYNTIIFQDNILTRKQHLKIENPAIESLVKEWLSAEELALDKQFVYYLLAAKGVCVVPVSSFCSDLQGFRVTLLEEDEELLVETFTRIKEGLEEYLSSDPSVAAQQALLETLAAKI